MDPVEVKTAMMDDAAAMKQRLQLLTEHRIPIFEVSYEELYDNDSTFEEKLHILNKLFVFLGVNELRDNGLNAECHKLFDPAIYRWASADTYKFIPGIERIERDVGCDETGWLFK
jgi:hypothetical protein